ncbi:MAG: hypothetical protein ACOYVF_05980 [Candidatus Zixiibacteriota bacterium]
MLKIVEIASIASADERWQAYHRLMAHLKKEFGSLYQMHNGEELKKSVLSFIAREQNYDRVLICENDRLVGWADTKVFNAGTPDELLSIRFDSVYDIFPVELSRVLAQYFYRGLLKYNIPHLFFISQDKRLIQIALGWGGRKMHRNDEYVLYRKRANIALMKSWLEEIPARNPDLKLRFFPETLEEYFEPFARVLSRCLNDMPQEGDDHITFLVSVEDLKGQVAWRRENGIPSYKYVLFDQRNEIIGLTMVEMRAKYPQEASQAMTGVLESYRGRGLAKWLKAAMFFKVGEDFPENVKITTMMRAVNLPMQHINLKMGYVLEREGMEMKVTGVSLAGFLNYKTGE